MRIIKQGVDPITKPHECTCRNCKTVFECVRTDCKFIPHDPRTMDQREMVDSFSVACPHCGESVWFTNPDWKR